MVIPIESASSRQEPIKQNIDQPYLSTNHPEASTSRQQKPFIESIQTHIPTEASMPSPPMSSTIFEELGNVLNVFFINPVSDIVRCLKKQ